MNREALANEMRQYMAERMEAAQQTNSATTIAYWAGMTEMIGIVAKTSGSEEYQAAYEAYLQRGKEAAITAREQRQ